MIIRISRLGMALLLVVSLTVQALAAGVGSIEILLRGGSRPISGAEICVCRAGEPVKGGYRLSEQFGGGFISEVDILSPELAAFLAEKASGAPSCKTDREGSAKFSGLDEGLYLVLQTEAAGGYAPFAPFLITLPWDGDQWDITATPKTERLVTPVPDTSDPGTVDRGILGMTLSGLGLTILLLSRRKWLS